MSGRQQDEDLKLRLKYLEREYDLAIKGLLVGGLTTTFAIIGLLLSVGIEGLFQSGWQIVVLVGVVAVAVIVYYSFVFGRLIKIRADISKTKQKIEVESGKSIRSR